MKVKGQENADKESRKEIEKKVDKEAEDKVENEADKKAKEKTENATNKTAEVMFLWQDLTAAAFCPLHR